MTEEELKAFRKEEREYKKLQKNLGIKHKRFYTNRQIIGQSFTIDSTQDSEYIRRIEKIPYYHLLDNDDEIRKLQFNYIHNRLREFRLGLYLVGIDIGFKRVQWLGALGYISSQIRDGAPVKHDNVMQHKYVSKFVITRDGTLSAYSTPESGTPEAYVYESKQYNINLDDLKLAKAVKNNKWKEIKKSDWAIDDVFKLPDDVYEFILNINKGWQFYKECDRFNTYREQAYIWLERNYTLDPSWSEEEQLDFLEAERARCLENSLYAVNKYLWAKDPDDPMIGEFKVKAWKAQEVVLFLIDLRLSLIIGKLRQIGFTTIIAGLFGIRTMLSKNYFAKFVAQKEKKSDEIFEDKVKFAISKCDSYMKPSFANWSGEKVTFGVPVKKGAERPTESKFEVVAPSEDAINGGTPSITLLDEIGFMKLFGAIMSQGRPTMFKLDHKTGKMKLVRQVIAWGTGGKTGGAGSAMMVEWQAAKEAFAQKDFRHGLIPLFLNYYAKPGHDDEFYEAEKKQAYSKKKQVGEEDPRIVFHQSFPIDDDDMFMESSDTVIATANINANINRLNTRIAVNDLKSVRGYFEPIFDMSRPRGEDSYVPYAVIGARFVRADQSIIDEKSEFACIEMFEQPDDEWDFRYFKGTDPIFTSSGHSKFASVIRDRKTKKVVCKLNFKSDDYRFEYLQSFLMNLYYSRSYGGKKLGILELLEFNVGGEYYNFCRDLGYGNIFVGNKMLPQNLQTTTIDIGINKRGTNGPLLINKLEELLFDFGNKIDDIEFWIQLKTFVRKQIATGIKYEPLNKKIHYDDLIDAHIYSYICEIIHAHREMKLISSSKLASKELSKKVLYYDSRGFLRRGVQRRA